MVLNSQIDLEKHRKALLIQMQNRNTEEMKPRCNCSNLYNNEIEIEISCIPGTELSLVVSYKDKTGKSFIFL